ncbi:uncharacterized protein LOC133198794 [Saccostrea echinata]|uniref:uncharacterized protein LOC133198794 n=1 Tax=Saccostrea echinata TaxID=191078 RepID=UPI002A825793|nr:uncharacterized protein LOC133198794 [Saccostrea echinata]XP_061190766.1 uncharacterized protein LOC133198794 [Saccostrea echinata]
MSIPAIVSLLVALIFVSVVLEGIDAQSCSDVTTCSSDYTSAASSAGQDKNKICKAANDYVTCLEAAAKTCDTDISQTIDAARNALSQAGCSTPTAGSEAPVLSFVTIILAVVISRFV